MSNAIYEIHFLVALCPLYRYWFKPVLKSKIFDQTYLSKFQYVFSQQQKDIRDTHILKDEVSSPLKRTMNQTTKVYPWLSQEAFPTLSPVSYSSQQAQMLTVIY